MFLPHCWHVLTQLVSFTSPYSILSLTVHFQLVRMLKAKVKHQVQSPSLWMSSPVCWLLMTPGWSWTCSSCQSAAGLETGAGTCSLLCCRAWAPPTHRWVLGPVFSAAPSIFMCGVTEGEEQSFMTTCDTVLPVTSSIQPRTSVYICFKHLFIYLPVRLFVHFFVCLFVRLNCVWVFVHTTFTHGTCGGQKRG